MSAAPHLQLVGGPSRPEGTPSLRERLLATWRAWEAHPSGEIQAREMEAATKACADAAGVKPNVLRDLLTTFRRAGLDLPDCIAIASKAARLVAEAKRR